MRLQNKVILITGAGSGIGKSSALLFASEGGIIAVNDVNEQNGVSVVEEIQQKEGQAAFFAADITKPAEVERMVEQLIAQFGRIDVLFNNAGISGVGFLHETDPEDWDRIFAVNVKGVFLVSKYVLPHMMRQRSGSIINMSSCIAEIGLARRTSYAATKGAVLSLTKSMQVDYSAYNIRVNALLPGTVYTPFVEHYLKTSYDDPEAAYEALKSRQLGGDLARPDDVAKAALFLASDDSKHMMGSPLYLDAGTTFGKHA